MSSQRTEKNINRRILYQKNTNQICYITNTNWKQIRLHTRKKLLTHKRVVKHQLRTTGFANNRIFRRKFNFLSRGCCIITGSDVINENLNSNLNIRGFNGVQMIELNL